MKNLLTTLLLLVGVSAFGQGTAIRSQNGFGTNTSFYGITTNATINQMGSSVLGSLWTLLDTNGLNRIAIVSTNMTFRDTNNIQLRISPNGVEAVTVGFVGNGAGLTNLTIPDGALIWTQSVADVVSLIDEVGSPNQLTYDIGTQVLNARQIKTIDTVAAAGEITLGYNEGGIYITDGNANPVEFLTIDNIDRITISGVIRVRSLTGDIEFGPGMWHIDPNSLAFLPGAIGGTLDNVNDIGASSNRIATVYAASVISDNFTGNGAGLTNLNLGSFTNQAPVTFNGRVTLVSNVFLNVTSYSTNSAASETTIDLSKNYRAFATNNNTAFSALEGIESFGTNFQSVNLFITNSSGSVKTITMSAAFQNVNAIEGNTLNVTNLGHLLVFYYPGLGTNFYFKSR